MTWYLFTNRLQKNIFLLHKWSKMWKMRMDKDFKYPFTLSIDVFTFQHSDIFRWKITFRWEYIKICQRSHYECVCVVRCAEKRGIPWIIQSLMSIIHWQMQMKSSENISDKNGKSKEIGKREYASWDESAERDGEGENESKRTKNRVCLCLLVIGLLSSDTFLICLDNKSRFYTITNGFL